MGDDFEDFIKDIAGQLPNLREITLCGITNPEPWSLRYCNESRLQDEKNSCVRDNAERFVLRGGVAPGPALGVIGV